MKRSLAPFATTLSALSAGALIIAGAFATPVLAQGAPSAILPQGAPPAALPNTEYGEHHKNVEEFGDFLDNNPDVQKDLSKHPDLIHNPDYVNSHPDLKNYLQSHPQAAKRFEAHPHHFMHRERHYEHSVKRYDKKHHTD
jgi:hypothetical protein